MVNGNVIFWQNMQFIQLLEKWFTDMELQFSLNSAKFLPLPHSPSFPSAVFSVSVMEVIDQELVRILNASAVQH